MAKTFLYRFFGIGKLPANLISEFHAEGPILMDEGIRGTVTYKNFRGGGRVSNWKRQWFGGAVVLTQKRLVGYRIRQRVFDVELNDPRCKQIEFSVEPPETFLVAFDASLFQPDWSGNLEFRFRTPIAYQILERINNHRS